MYTGYDMSPTPPAALGFLPALKPILGPWGIALALAVGLGWTVRDGAQSGRDLSVRVAQLDSVAVKQPQFERVVERLEAVAARQDSTNALLRRFICREQPTVCP